MKSRTGFTLIELVVVILILGILAGVAAPKMFDTSAKATDNTLKQTLAIIRDAIELYTADPDNGAATPGNPPAWTDSDTFHTQLSKYLRGSFPICPVGPNKNNTVVSAVATSEGTGEGWRYNPATGEFAVNSDDGSATNALIKYDTF